MANVLLKRSSLDTDRIPSEHEGRIWDDVSVNQRILINHQDLGEQHGTHFFLTAFRTNQLLISDWWWDKEVLLLKPVSLRYFVMVALSLCCRFSPVWLFVTLWTAAHEAPLPMGFSRQEYWSWLSFSSPGDLPDAGIKPASHALTGRFLTTVAPGKPQGAVHKLS